MEETTAATPKQEPKKYGKYEKWEIESAARTLSEAEEIKEDAEKMKYVKMCLEEQVESSQKALGKISEITSIDDLKSVRKEKLEKKEEK